MNLRRKSGIALSWDLAGNYAGQSLSFIISIFLARLLEPSQFGVVGMTLAFINIVAVFPDIGFASALIQNKDNTSLTYSSVFYINLLAGLCLTVFVFFASPLIGSFYENDQITILVKILSFSFFINSLNIVQRTILRKNLDFKVLTFRGIASQAIAGTVGVIFAFNGFGVYALVIQYLLGAAINTIILWRVAEWYPKVEFSLKEVRKLTSFSTYVFAAQATAQLVSQLDALFIGKLFNPATLGYFSRANSLNSIINKNSASSINRVFFPMLSSIKDDDQRFRGVYLKVVNLVAGISIFLTGIFFLIGEEMIILLFGRKWEPSVAIFKFLLIRGFTFPISLIIVNAFLAKGKSKENFHYGNIRKILSLVPFLAAYLCGFDAFLYSVTGVALLGWLLNNYFVTLSLNISIRDQMSAVMPYLVIGSLTVGSVWLIFPSTYSVGTALVQVGIFVTVYAISCSLLRLMVYREMLFYLEKLLRWLKA